MIRHVRFTKMHGLGNDLIVLEAVEGVDLRAQAPLMCDRHRGIGADGLLIIDQDPDEPCSVARVTIINRDGSDGGMCGNGLRCVARLLHAQGRVDDTPFTLAMDDRAIEVQVLADGRVRTLLGPAVANLEPRTIDEHAGYACDVGNPHLVVFVDQTPPPEAWDAFAQRVQRAPGSGGGVNVHALCIDGPAELRMLSWERGVGLTRACASGACACAWVAHAMGRVPGRVRVRMDGGELDAEMREDGRGWITGEAASAFEGVWTLRDAGGGGATLADAREGGAREGTR